MFIKWVVINLCCQLFCPFLMPNGELGTQFFLRVFWLSFVFFCFLFAFFSAFNQNRKKEFQTFIKKGITCLSCIAWNCLFV
jgi:hypothetical protein